VLVIADNLIRAPAIQLGKGCGAARDACQVLYQPFLLARGANSLVALAESLQDGLR
jgi:hypothetical protein